MIRQTSIETFRRIEAEGLLSQKRLEVYRILFPHGPLTATQIADRMAGIKSPSVGANIHARLGELRETGCVKELGIVECPITHNNVILWDVTADLPRPFKHVRKKHHDTSAYVYDLCAKIAEEEAELANDLFSKQVCYRIASRIRGVQS